MGKTTKKKVAVMTVAFNRPQALDICLDSLRKNNHPELFDLFVVDNASSDDVSGVIKKHKAHYLRLERNYFVARALNEGFRHFGLAQKYDYVLLTGSDVLADPRLISDLSEAMDRDPAIGVCGPSHYQIHSNKLLSIGLSISGLTSLLINTTSVEQKKPINHFHSLYMVRTDAFQKVNGYDSLLYPMIYEEPDLGERLIRKGYTLVPHTPAKIWHPIDQPKPQTKDGTMRIPKDRLYNSFPKAYLFFRNRIIYMSTYAGPLRFLLFYFLINPLISLYYLPDLDKKFIKIAMLGWWHGTIFALTRNRKYIEARNKSVLNI